MNTDNKEEKFGKVRTIVIDLGKIRQTKAFARQDGAILGAVWVVSFALTMLAVEPQYQLLGLLANVLTLSTPFVVARRLKSFRDYALEGAISFKNALYYSWHCFFYATLLLTIVQYLWFRFMDTGMFMSQLTANYQMVMQAYELSAQEAKTVMEAIAQMKPIAWASLFMITDLVAGIILSPIIAAIMAKKPQNGQQAAQQQ